MIIFKQLSLRNFKSVGNSPLIVQLNDSKLTLVTGKNGSGKSTFTSAICFALFGQDFTINKPGLVNSINQKQLEVILDFSVDGKQYSIIRGIKPAVFKIFEDGKLLNEDSTTKDYQKILETQILKMDIRAFKQVIVVGGRSYVPFMKLKSNDRREFIEDLLDIKIFSTMSVLSKEKLKLLKEEIKIIDEQIKTVKEKVVLQESFIKKLTAEKNNSVSKIENNIEFIKDENNEFSKIIDKLQKEQLLLLDNVSSYEKTKEELSNIKNKLDGLKNKKSSHLSKINFYKNTKECPTCTQIIEENHRDFILKENTKEINLCIFEIDKFEDSVLKIQEKIDEFLKIQKNVSIIQTDISEYKNKISSNLRIVSSANNQIEEMKKDNNSIDVEKSKLKVFAKNFVEFDKAKKSLLEQKQYYEYINQILADGGIKTRIIKKYIPTINTLINKYLNLMDFFVSFNLDENFDESIKSRHRDTFKYENFSDGQASRIDLALMFAWRDIAKMRNAVNTNLAIFDESDASMDVDGSSLLTDLFETLSNSNVIIISHKEAMKDKVNKVLTLELKDNFTVISTE